MIRYQRKTIDYQINMVAYREMLDYVPMTRPERDALRSWAIKGYDIETNPWDYHDSDGELLNYLQAYRLEYGYSSGPWDYWKGPDQQSYWDNETRSFISKEDYC